MTLGIFIADRSGSRWIRVRPFPHNSPDYNIAHPTLSVDGTRLFFASDMPGGYGGMDIYMSVLENNQWSKPVNLGPSINTSADEAFPVIHATGRLFFSSKGHGTKGGFDIFYSDLLNNTWLNPVRLDDPFNSSYDDFPIWPMQNFRQVISLPTARDQMTFIVSGIWFHSLQPAAR
jgi:Tol biopolymer transport system component